MPITRITAKDFADAFNAEWECECLQRRDALEALYANDKAWTSFMLSPGGLIERAAERLKARVPTLVYYPEMYKIDAALVGGVDLFRTDLSYPSEIHVLIEQENGPNIEEELWKLLFWRSPLKVLFVYDWNEELKVTGLRQRWLSEKLSKVSSMIATVAETSPAPGFSEYLIIVFEKRKAEWITWRSIVFRGP